MLAPSRRCARALLAATALLLVACTGERVFIRPSEIPKVSGTFSQPMALGPNNTLVRHSIVRLVREDGMLVDLNGNVDLVVILKDGHEHVFEHPLAITDAGTGYDILSSNHQAAHVEKADITRAAVVRSGPN